MPTELPPGELPAGMTTLRVWAARHGRTHDHVRKIWRHQDGFPAPSGVLAARGRHGGGRGELYFDEAALDRWLAAQSDLAPKEPFDPATLRIDPDERITLARFAAILGIARNTVAQYRDQVGFPKPDADGTYHALELLGFWNSRPGRRGKTRRPSPEG